MTALRQARLDVDRDKVYDQQERFFASLTPGRNAWAHPSMSHERAEEIVCNLEEHFGVAPLNVTKSSQVVQAAAYSRRHRTIRLYGISPKWVILHEFAHALVDHRIMKFAKDFSLNHNNVADTIMGHGPSFLRAYIDVVEAQWGHVEGLVEAFETHMVEKTGIIPSDVGDEWLSVVQEAA